MEKVIYIISGSLHILAAITWIGSVIYGQFAVVPALNTSLGSTKTHAVGGLITKNFSPLTWISLIVLIATGIFATVSKSDKFTSWTSGPGGVLTLKLILVGVLVIILSMQTFTTKSTQNEAEMIKLEKTTDLLSWWHLAIGIIVVVLSVVLTQLLG